MNQMRIQNAVVVAAVAVSGFLVPTEAEPETLVNNGRIDRTINVGASFDDFELYLPNGVTSVAVYAQWNHSSVIPSPTGFDLLCLRGPDGTTGPREDDDISWRDHRATSYKIQTGRVWWLTSVSGQRCWLTLDFQHKDRYDQAATSTFTVIVSGTNIYEGTWPASTAAERWAVEQVEADRARRAR